VDGSRAKLLLAVGVVPYSTKRRRRSGNKEDPIEATNDGESIGYQLSFRYIVGALFCIRLLLELGEAERFLVKHRRKKATLDSARELLEGYKLAVVLPLHTLLEQVVDFPETFGVASKDGLSTILHWGEGAFPIPAGNSVHENLVRNIWWIRTKVISARTWEDLRGAAFSVEQLLSSMDEITNRYYVAKLRKPPEVKGIPELAPVIVVDHLHIFYHDQRNISIAYAEMYRGGSDRPSRGIPRRGRSRIGRESGRAEQLLRGFSFAVSYLWWRVVGPSEFDGDRELFARISSAATWDEYDALYGDIGRFTDQKLGELGLVQTLRRGLQFDQTRPISPIAKAPLLTPMSEGVPETDQMTSIFEMRPIRVGASNDFTRLQYFIYLFTGLLAHSRRAGGKVKFLRLKHKDPFGNRFSYALFVPAYGSFISNASEYWLVLDAATDFSGNGNQIRRIIDGLIDQGGQAVDVREHEIPDLRTLEQFVESKQFKYMHSRVEEFEALLSAFRGVIAELLLAELLRREKLTVIDLRRRLRWLDGREVDVVAAEPGPSPRVLLIECKANLRAIPIGYMGETTGPSHEMNRDMQDALNFVRAVSERSTETKSLFEELGLTGPGSVTSVVASFGTVEGEASEILKRDAEIWEWEALAERFARAKIDRLLWEPLEHFALEDGLAAHVLHLGEDLFSYVDVSLSK